MATKNITVYTSDLTPDKPADETVIFMLNGKTHEIDLTHEEAQTLYNAFSKYVEAGRTVTNVRGSKTASRGSKTPSRAAAIRAWAKEQGISVNERGRVSPDVVAKYDAAKH